MSSVVLSSLPYNPKHSVRMRDLIGKKRLGQYIKEGKVGTIDDWNKDPVTNHNILIFKFERELNLRAQIDIKISEVKD